MELPNFSPSILAGTQAELCIFTLRFAPPRRPGVPTNSLHSFISTNRLRTKFTCRIPTTERARSSTPNDKDFIFRESGKQLMPILTKEAQGYGAKFDIGLRT